MLCCFQEFEAQVAVFLWGQTVLLPRISKVWPPNGPSIALSLTGAFSADQPVDSFRSVN
jgi:hypothetical protein